MDLAVFPEEVPIPCSTIFLLWMYNGLDEKDTFDLLTVSLAV